MQFDRENLALLQNGWKGEGFWRTPDWVKEKSSHKSFYEKHDEGLHIPFKHDSEWSGKSEFVNKLRKIQKNVTQLCANGLSPSRFEKDKYLGSLEFRDSKAHIAWPGDYLEYYIEKHNVKPSREFYNYVLDWTL